MTHSRTTFSIFTSLVVFAFFTLAFGYVAHAETPGGIPTVDGCQGSGYGYSYSLNHNQDGTYTCSYTDTSGEIPDVTLYNYDSSKNYLNGSSPTLGTNIDKKGNTTSAPVKCDGVLSSITNPGTCIFRAFAAGTGSVLITLTAWLLEIVGLLFNYLVYYTIIAFGDANNGFLTTGVLDAINQAWTVFRDIANILIIGLFTFVAISTILGLKEFGAKKMIARVLIIAVLINFSLLFTKMIVDGSNFLAYQFYNSASGLSATGMPTGSTQAASATDSIGSLTSFASNGIAGRFITFMGVTSFTDTLDKLKTGADTADSGWTALLHGLFGATMLLAAALVLLYGCFLLTSRAILIVFLLITSSLAFASHLIPKFSSSTYGWDGWWSSLIKSAVFAPLLMMFLWATLMVANGLNTTGRGTLGKLMSDPTNGGNLSALFGYILILGLLFASFKISSSFSSSIGGFSFAAMIPALGVGMAARVAGFAGRQTIGRPALAIGDKMQKASQDQSRSLFARQLYDFGAQRFKGVAKRDFNASRIPGIGGALQGATGLKEDTISGAKKKGFEGTEKARAEKFVEKAGRMKLSDDEKKELEKNARSAILKTDPDLAQRHAEATATKEAGEGGAAQMEKERAAMSEEFARSLKPLQEAAESMRQAAVANPGNEAAQGQMGNSRRVLEAEKQRQVTELGRIAQRINDAKLVAQRGNEALKHIENTLDDEAVRQGLRPSKKDFKDEKGLASEMAYKRFSNLLFRAAGLSTEKNDRLTKLAGKGVGDHHKKKNAKEAIEFLKHTAGEDEHGAAHPPAAAPRHAPAAPAREPEPHHEAEGHGVDDHHAA